MGGVLNPGIDLHVYQQYAQVLICNSQQNTPDSKDNSN